MTIYNVKFQYRNGLKQIETTNLWVIARSVKQAITKAERHARKHFDDKRAIIIAVELRGTVDVL